MFCDNCGKEVKEGAIFCPNCGKEIRKVQDKKENAKKIKYINPDKSYKVKARKALTLPNIIGIIILISAFAILDDSQTEMETGSNGKSMISQDKSSVVLFTDLPGLAGAYVDTDTGERLAVAEDGYLWAYTYYDKNGDVKCNEVECDWENALGGYIAGEQFNIMQDDAGILKLSLVDSSDGMYGNFRKVSGTTNTVRNVEGKYVNGTDYILVFNQMVDVDDEDVPTGADIADAVIYSSRTGKFTARLYTEQYGTLAIINSSNEVVKGIITFENGNAIVSGSAFDGTFELEKQ